MSIVIAIDGPAASGKGTLSRALSEYLGFPLMDTGALYRATALELRSILGGKQFDATDTGSDVLIEAVTVLKDKIRVSRKPSDVLGNPELRTDDVAELASQVASVGYVREALLELQRNFSQSEKEPNTLLSSVSGVILDGRDIGTVVCPDAQVKLYITANTEIRAQRRQKELQSRGIHATYEAVLKDMRERDARDAGRETAPMKPAKDAVIIDTSKMSENDVFKKALAIITQHTSIAPAKQP